MIPGLANSAMMEIATSVRRIPAFVFLSTITPTDFGIWDRYTLPADCWQVVQNGLMDIGGVMSGGNSRFGRRFIDYKVFIDGSLLLPKGTDVTSLVLEYRRYPATVNTDTPDSTELDGVPETHEAIVYYVAADILEYDDAYRAQIFRKMYLTKIARIRETMWMEPAPILNWYAGE